MQYDDDRPARGSNELILNPGEYAFLQDKAKGTVQTVVGPDVVTQSGQLRPIQFREGRFQETTLQGAVEQCVVAAKGEYVVLHNPSADQNGLNHPDAGTANGSVPSLRHGEKIVVPGPCQFALWPEQEAEVVEGHDLRDDQFLIVRVYDQDAAVANWSDAVVEVSESDDDETTVATQTADELGLTLGKLLIIKGVSFYIPPTGVEVVQDDDENYVRDALTLEMSEYAILVDQSGNKRYERGPQIVFPEPTESFFKDNGNIKFRPIELTPTQGIHLKINCDYTDQNWPTETGTTTRTFTEGEEVFITGATHPIYYPCEEHSIVRYGENLIHYATAVPAGQGRYVLDKNTGEHRLIEGPDMVLLDPTKDVFLTRALSDNESLLMYPGNTDSLTYNRSLRQFQIDSGGEELTSEALEAHYEDFSDFGHQAKTLLGAVTRSAGGPRKLSAGSAALPDQLKRKTKYTEPHSVQLDDNRFKGVPTLRIWTGFAVLLVKADGTRRVEVGPKTVMLDYDETVQALHLSTGKPKTTDNLITTGYLEVSNNKVSDILTVETEDGVKVQIKVSYRVSFTGDPMQWFNVDNYVKFLCDNARSRLKGVARHHTVRDFYNNTVDIVRDTILGEKIEDEERDGLLFTENGMHVTEVDLLDVSITDPTISQLLIEQQQAVVTDEIEIDRANQNLKVATATQKVEMEKLALAEQLRIAQHELSLAKFENQVQLADLRAKDQLQRAEEATILAAESEKAKQVEWDADLARASQRQELELANASAATREIVARFKAAEGDLAAAINRLGDEELLAKVAEAMGPMRLIGGGSLTDVISGVIGAVGNNSKLVDRLNTLVDTHTNA